MQNIFKTDGSHWYSMTGSPVYEVENASRPGEKRSVTLRDARKLNLVPSVTTIQKIIAKDGLQRWRELNLVLAALTLPRNENEGDDVFAARIIEDAFSQSDEAKNTGVAIHDRIEVCIREKEYSTTCELAPFVNPVLSWVKTSKIFNPDLEVCFASPAGFGGRIDLIDFDNRIIVDWKTQSTKNGKFSIYPEHGEQLAAYSRGVTSPKTGMKCPDFRHINVYISTTQPGLIKIHEWEDTLPLYSNFLAAMQIWQDRKNYKAGGSDD